MSNNDMAFEQDIANMNEYQLKANLDSAAARVQRIAGRLDNIDMNLIEYEDGNKAKAEAERYESLKAQYEEACAEVAYWASKVNAL